MKTGSETGDLQRNEGRAFTKKRSMLFKILRRKSDERTRFTTDSDTTFNLVGKSGGFEQAAGSFGFHHHQGHQHTESLESHMVPDLNSSITNGTTAHQTALEEPGELPEFVPNVCRTDSFVSALNGELAPPEFATRDLPEITTGAAKTSSSPFTVDDDDFHSVQNFKRTLEIPVIATSDPNAVCIDDTLEPIHAVVTEYSQQLNEAFFSQEDEEFEQHEASFEQIITRRQKLKQALKFKFRNNRKTDPLGLN